MRATSTLNSRERELLDLSSRSCIMFGRRRGYGRRYGGGGGGLGMVLLAMQLLHLFQFLSNSNNYYPVTLGVLGLNLLAFFQPGRHWPSIHQACISVRGAWFEREWKRIFLASFYHSGDFHLYYNMASFIWKAISLESYYGSGYFLYMVAVFSVSTNLVYIAINYALAEFLDQWSYINSCAVGFSGVLFALKVVATHIQPAGMTRVMGFIPVPMRIACWVELVLISVLFPHVSFVGHLAGILVGFLFIYGPLQVIMNVPLSILTGTLRSLAKLDFDAGLPDVYRKLAIAGVGLFMIISPLLIDLIPTGTETRRGHYASDGHSYTYRSGTTGHREAEQQQQQQQGNRAPNQPAERQYHSYTYAAGPSGEGEREGSEETELQEAIRRSLSTASEERDGNTQTAISGSLREGQPPEMNPSAPPCNPDYSTQDENSSPPPDVGWNRDLLEQTGDTDDDSTTSHPPIGFEALNNSNPDSIPGESMGTGVRHRRNETQRGEGVGVEREDDVGRRGSGSLTREEMREARLLRLGAGGGRRPLSQLSGHSFSFKK